MGGRGGSVLKNQFQGAGGGGLLKNQFQGGGVELSNQLFDPEEPTLASQDKLKVSPKGLPFVILLNNGVDQQLSKLQIAPKSTSSPNGPGRLGILAKGRETIETAVKLQLLFWAASCKVKVT